MILSKTELGHLLQIFQLQIQIQLSFHSHTMAQTMAYTSTKACNVRVFVRCDWLGAVGLDPFHKINDLCFAVGIIDGVCGAHGAN